MTMDTSDQPKKRKRTTIKLPIFMVMFTFIHPCMSAAENTEAKHLNGTIYLQQSLKCSEFQFILGIDDLNISQPNVHADFKIGSMATQLTPERITTEEGLALGLDHELVFKLGAWRWPLVDFLELRKIKTMRIEMHIEQDTHILSFAVDDFTRQANELKALCFQNKDNQYYEA